MSWVPILTQLYKEIRYSPPILFLLLLTALKRCVLYYSIDTRGAADGTYIIEDGWQQHRIADKRDDCVHKSSERRDDVRQVTCAR